MMVNFKKFMVSMATVFSLNVSATGIPVVDVSNLAQALQTVAQLRAQLQQLQQMHDAVTGSRGMGALLNQPQLRQYLPTSTQNLYSSGSTGLSAMDGNIDAIKRAEALGNDLAAERAQLETRKADAAVKNKAMTQLAYTASMKRLDNIEALAKQIDFATDEKATLDLQNRLNSELSLIQSEQQRAQLVGMLQSNEQAVIQQKAREINKKIVNPANTGMPSF